MITENLLNNADERVRSLCVEKGRIRFWFYVWLGISTLFGLMIIYFIYFGKSNINELNF
jgi:hypothetical protein